MRLCHTYDSQGAEPEHDRTVRRVSEHVQLSHSPHILGALLPRDQPAQSQGHHVYQVSVTYCAHVARTVLSVR